MMGGGMLFGWLFLIGVVVLVVWLLRSAAGPGHGPSPAPDLHTRGKNSAIGILEERFARGEIDKPEFEERKEELLHAKADQRGA